jgi:hypothetical protein
MGLNWMAASGAMPPPDPDRSREIAAKFGVTLTPFEGLLRAKARLQPARAACVRRPSQPPATRVAAES